MSPVKTKELLQDPQIVEQINKHKWIESEKAGYDIGFDRAAEDWIEHYSHEWLRGNVDKKKNAFRTSKSRKRIKE